MLNFYDIDENYINFLKIIDSQVPNVKYDANNKFVCGIVLKVNGVNYYAPVNDELFDSAYNANKFANI